MAIRRQLRLFLGTPLLCKFTIFASPPEAFCFRPESHRRVCSSTKCDTATPSRCKNNERRRRVLFSGRRRELHKTLSLPQPETQPVHTSVSLSTLDVCVFLFEPINKCVRVCMYLFQKAISGAAAAGYNDAMSRCVCVIKTRLAAGETTNSLF